MTRSMDQYETVEGTDWTESELQQVRDRDASLVKREQAVDWMQLGHHSASTSPQILQQ